MRAERILIIDDEKLIRWSLRQELSKAGFGVLEAASVAEALASIRDNEPDLIVLDQLLPDGTGIDVLRHLQSANTTAPVIMLTAIDRSDVAVQAMKLGAVDYVTKPVNVEELSIVIERALEATKLRRQVAHLLKSQQHDFGFCGMIGSSSPMRRVFDDISKIAQSSRTTVLITGPSGTGKELAAQAIHSLSDRRDRALMTVNFSALSENLIESELFGHEKGAFTDARTQKKGIFELADQGTIFLDEIGDVSLKIQVKLLRVLEQKTFQRVGGTADITVDVRIIAATNQVLEDLVAQGKFRSDLYYRLNVASIVIPPLRQRGDDILLLAEYFLQELNARFHRKFNGFTEEVRKIFLEYDWPGNVRELRNVLERAVLLNDDTVVRPAHVELMNWRRKQDGSLRSDSISSGSEREIPLFELEKRALEQALEKSSNNQSQAARLLGISRDTLRYRMKKHGLFPRGG